MISQVTRGLFRGAKRGVMTSKQGHNYYKGTRTGSMGKHGKHGGYAVNWDKVRTYVVPDLEGCELKPYVSHRSPKLDVKPPSLDEFK